ncbi:Glycosyltransferase involved in cell wall bisynthesis [Prevotella sp. tc2-28]|uniref:glycosyltransferase family 2 protein n=1 Tax=Prevotella sp. tc2-28 TaxID=1761888 RepID=UPI00089D6A1F|nr:glycosyltransferase [Prevotella sp. tc2-28]SEA52003.1 Glycosyltransferase involved in cell wall bisynthesis [Prevotella sp. tc2-28]
MISVIIPVYNSEKYLDECIGSVLGQTYQDFELLLIDDGSMDNSLEILHKWKAEDSRIILLTQQNSGASSARNRGLETAKGEWIVFVDSDDKVCSNYLQDLYDATQKDLNIDLCIDGLSVYSEGKWNNDWNFPEIICPISDAKTLFGEIKLHKYGFSVGKLYRKRIIENNNLEFDVKVCIAEDMMFMVKYIIAASQRPNSKIAFINKCNYKYYIHQGSLSTSCSSFDKELYSLNEYKNIINSIWSVFNINDISIKYTMMSPVSFYMDRCLNSIFQRPVSSNWRKQLKMINRDDYQKYKKCNTSFESLLKYLFVHRFWFLLYLLRR